MRKPFVAGNWKMNTDRQTSVALANEIALNISQQAGETVDVAVIPPFVYIPAVIKALNNTKISVGSQDLYYESEGAFTGEISARMLKDIGCTYVLCGHSERRHILGEDNELVNKKVHAAISGGLLPILCIGETREQREASQTEDIVGNQLKTGLKELTEEKAPAVTLAYEPVWAIGTGLTATPQQAQEVHAFIRELLEKIYDKNLAQDTRILYGGSAKPSNAAELMAQPDIDGTLVGGASLKAEDFTAIINAAI